MLRKLLCVWALAVFAAIGCFGCTKEANRDGGPIVYASFYPIYDLVHQVAGDTVELRMFMPPNADPHLWEPSPKEMRHLAEADVLFVNGANMERWLDAVRAALPELKVVVLSDGVELISYKGAAAVGDFQYMASFPARAGETFGIDFGHTHEDVMRVAFLRRRSGEDLLDLIARGKEAMEAKGKLIAQGETIDVEEGMCYAIEMGHESGKVSYRFDEDGEWLFLSDRISETLLPYTLVGSKGEPLGIEVLLSGSTSGFDKVTYDPHSWMGLQNAKLYLNSICDTLTDMYDHKRTYQRNKVQAVDALTDLEIEYRAKFREVSRKEFIVTHYAYAYVAREFDLIQYPLQGLVSTQTPSLKTIRKAIDYCRAKGIRTVFYEEGMEAKGADTLAQEVGGRAEGLQSMEYVKPGAHEEPGGYTRIMRENLEKIYESLKGGSDEAH